MEFFPLIPPLPILPHHENRLGVVLEMFAKEIYTPYPPQKMAREAQNLTKNEREKNFYEKAKITYITVFYYHVYILEWKIPIGSFLN